METITTQATPNASGEQGTRATVQRQGGFIQGAVAAQGCCGETSSGSGGCCGTPAQATATDATVQPATQIGCCGSAAPKTAASTAIGGCCS